MKCNKLRVVLVRGMVGCWMSIKVEYIQSYLYNTLRVWGGLRLGFVFNTSAVGTVK